MKRWIKITIPIVVVVLMIGFLGWRIVASKAAKPAKTVTATMQTVSKDVAFTGNVTAKKSANLAFELSGIVKETYVEVGDTVKKGQKLALLDPQSAELQVAKAHADAASTTSAEYLAWQKASQDATATIQEDAKSLEQKRQAVRDAKTALDQSKALLEQRVRESGDSGTTTLTTGSIVVANEAAYNAAKAALATAIKTTAKTDASAKKAADIAYSAYVSAVQAAPGDTGLSSLQALSQIAKINATKTVMRAPFDGIITNKNIEVGELAAAGGAIMTVETPDSFELTSDVPETDALGLAVGMNASITFDALPAVEEMPATVTSIYPAAKEIEGVPTFHVTLTLNDQLPQLRSGLTTNITVHAASKDNVLAIPRRAVIKKDNKEYVRKQSDKKTSEEVEITTGLVGSDGLVEVTSGVQEGDVLETP